MQQITSNVFVDTETRGSSHSFVVTSKGLVLIDIPVDRGDAQAWAQEVARHGKARYIVITEFHFDHCLNNHIFDAEIIASRTTSDLMREVNTEPYLRERLRYFYNHPIDVPSAAELQQGWPTITFTELMTLRLGRHTFEVVHCPGHTPGQTSVYVPEEKVLFAADNVSRTPHVGGLHDALPDKFLQSLEFYKTLDMDFLVTGHQGVIPGQDVRFCLDQQAAAVRQSVDLVKQAKADGLSVDEAAERIHKMFPRSPAAAAAAQDFRTPIPGDISPTRRWVAHLYHVTGGNVTEVRKRP